MQPEIEKTRQISLGGKTMDIMIEQVEAFTVMGLTYRFTDPSGRDGEILGKGLQDDFIEEAQYYGINTAVTYAITAEPSRIVNAKKYPPEKPSYYFK